MELSIMTGRKGNAGYNGHVTFDRKKDSSVMYCICNAKVNRLSNARPDYILKKKHPLSGLRSTEHSRPSSYGDSVHLVIRSTVS